MENVVPARRMVLAAVLIMAGGAAAWSLLPLLQWLSSARDALLGWGAAGIVVFITVYALAVVIFAPATPFTIAAGALYGFWGVPVSLVGAWIGALASFGIARGSLRERWAFLCKRRRLSDALDGVVTALGWKAVLLVRLSPVVPFSLQNYLFGMTGVSLGAFTVAGLVGMVPATIVKAFFGVVGAAGLAAKWPATLLAVLGASATILMTALFMRRVRLHPAMQSLRSADRQQ